MKIELSVRASFRMFTDVIFFWNFCFYFLCLIYFYLYCYCSHHCLRSLLLIQIYHFYKFHYFQRLTEYYFIVFTFYIFTDLHQHFHKSYPIFLHYHWSLLILYFLFNQFQSHQFYCFYLFQYSFKFRFYLFFFF